MQHFSQIVPRICTSVLFITLVRARHTVATEIPEAVKSAAKDLVYLDLKPEQVDIVETFVKGRDVFAVLPTGFGKSVFCLFVHCFRVV